MTGTNQLGVVAAGHPVSAEAGANALRAGGNAVDAALHASKILEAVYAPLPPKDIGTMMQQLVEAKFYSEGQIEMPLLETTVRAMKYVGMLDHDVDLTKMIDKSFLPADLQK